MPRPRTTTWFSPLWYAHHAITDTIEGAHDDTE